VRWLIPGRRAGVIDGGTSAPRTSTTASLDRAGQTPRIRLNSTVVHVQHQGDVGAPTEVVTSYVRGGKTYRVRSRPW